MHTGKPWLVGPTMRDPRREFTPVYGDGVLIAECPAYVVEERPIVAANARLIAAAPDLLAALRAFEEQATKLAGFPQAYDPYLGVLGLARAAIAKAIGG